MTDMSMYDQLAESVGAPGSEIIAKIFKFLTDDDEAKILVAASPPASVDEMSRATGIPAPRVQELVDALFRKGMMFKSKKKNPSRYYRVRQIVQFHDSTAVSRDLSPELVALWKEYMDSEWTAYREKITAALPSPRLRVIPVNITIQPETQILPFDDIITLINDADNIAVTACACRAIERACDTPDDTCLQLNRAADYAVERGTGRKLTREEAIDILKMCEEKGLVHSASNQRGPGHVICNCCDCCCMFPGPKWDTSCQAGSRQP